MPLAGSVGASEEVYFCNRGVNAKQWGGEGGSLGPREVSARNCPFSPPPQTSHHSGSASERTERARLTGLQFQSALCDVPNRNASSWGRDHGPALGQSRLGGSEADNVRMELEGRGV